jgi:hypothetical protein
MARKTQVRDLVVFDCSPRYTVQDRALARIIHESSSRKRADAKRDCTSKPHILACNRTGINRAG